MRLRWGIVLLLVAALASPAPARDTAAAPAANAAQAPRLAYELVVTEEILVTGQRPRGAVIGNVAPEIQLDEADIAAFGAGSVDELVDALAVQTGAGSGRPVVLVNGQRISGFEEIRDLPPEALERIDILPPEVALRYGYRADLRVVNLVLRPRYRSLTSEAGWGFATDGGRGSWQASANLTRIAPGSRTIVQASYQRAGVLLESERDIDGGFGRLRSLLPSSDQLAFGATLTRDVSSAIAATVNARVEALDSAARVGPPPAADPDPDRPLRRDLRSRTVHAGFSLRGPLGGWRWLFTGNYDGNWTRIDTDARDSAAADPRRRDLARNSGGFADLQLLAHGVVATLPAGPVQASLRTAWERQSYRSRSAIAGTGAAARLARGQATAQASLDLPLLGGGAVGEVSANFDVEASRVSDFGTLWRLTWGGRWSPVAGISLLASIADEGSAPSVQNLADPVVRTPNVRVFDFSRGESVDVDRIEGGNPALRAEQRRRVRFSLSLRPLPRTNLALTATYTGSRSRHPVAVLPIATAELEAAFPDRFVRDPAGRLVRIDARPVNFERAERDELRWGGTLSLPLGRSRPATVEPLPAGDSGAANDFDLRRLVRSDDERRGRLQLALYHSWRWRDQMRIRPDLPPLDFLDGDVVGARGGRPRHEIEFQAALLKGGLGARLTGRWQSATAVRVGGGSPPGRLFFGDQARVDLRLFANLGDLPIGREARWLQGARISLDVDNVFGSRPRVRDESGATPTSLQPDLLDPIGRSVRISLRKLF